MPPMKNSTSLMPATVNMKVPSRDKRANIHTLLTSQVSTQFDTIQKYHVSEKFIFANIHKFVALQILPNEDLLCMFYSQHLDSFTLII